MDFWLARLGVSNADRHGKFDGGTGTTLGTFGLSLSQDTVTTWNSFTLEMTSGGRAFRFALALAALAGTSRG